MHICESTLREEEQGCEMFAVQMKCQGPSEAEPRHPVDPAYLLIRIFNYTSIFPQ
jgi:hypothetical protein